MKGVNVTKFSETTNYDLEFSHIRQHGITCVRLMIKSLIQDKVSLHSLLNVLTTAYKHDIDIVLCMPNNRRWPDTDTKYTADQLRSFWVQVMSIGDQPAVVAYELCNEPKVDKWLSLQDELISLLRKHTNKPIVVTTPYVTWEFKAPLNDNNLLYSLHDYENYKFTHQGLNNIPLVPDMVYPGFEAYSSLAKKRITYDKNGKDIHYKKIRDFQDKFGVKIFIGEFSSINNSVGGDEWVKDSVELFNEYGWNWFYYEWFCDGATFTGWKPEANRMAILETGWA